MASSSSRPVASSSRASPSESQDHEGYVHPRIVRDEGSQSSQDQNGIDNIPPNLETEPAARERDLTRQARDHRAAISSLENCTESDYLLENGQSLLPRTTAVVPFGNVNVLHGRSDTVHEHGNNTSEIPDWQYRQYKSTGMMTANEMARERGRRIFDAPVRNSKYIPVRISDILCFKCLRWIASFGFHSATNEVALPDIECLEAQNWERRVETWIFFLTQVNGAYTVISNPEPCYCCEVQEVETEYGMKQIAQPAAEYALAQLDLLEKEVTDFLNSKKLRARQFYHSQNSGSHAAGLRAAVALVTRTLVSIRRARAKYINMAPVCKERFFLNEVPYEQFRNWDECLNTEVFLWAGKNGTIRRSPEPQLDLNVPLVELERGTLRVYRNRTRGKNTTIVGPHLLGVTGLYKCLERHQRIVMRDQRIEVDALVPEELEVVEGEDKEVTKLWYVANEVMKETLVPGKDFPWGVCGLKDGLQSAKKVKVDPMSRISLDETKQVEDEMRRDEESSGSVSSKRFGSWRRRY